MKNCPYYVELPSGVPVLSGSVGVVIHETNIQPILLYCPDWDLLFTQKGSAIFKLRNQQLLHVPEGYFLLLPPNTTMWVQPPRKKLLLGLLHFSFYPIPNLVWPSFRHDCLEIGRKVILPWIFSKKAVPKLWRAYHKTTHLNLLKDGPPWRMERSVIETLSELGQFALSLNIPEDTACLGGREGLDPRVAKICWQISRDPAFPWKVADLAKSVKLSIGHLERLCFACLRISLKRFIVERRLEYAAHLLRDRQGEVFASIKEVSSACGFTSQQFFSRQFRKFTGVSPLTYRQQWGEKT